MCRVLGRVLGKVIGVMKDSQYFSQREDHEIRHKVEGQSVW